LSSAKAILKKENNMRCIIFILCAILSTPAALALQPGTEGAYDYEYATKFICGEPDVPVVAPGRYFTAINVHNPNQENIVFRKKIAVALPSEKAVPRQRHSD